MRPDCGRGRPIRIGAYTRPRHASLLCSLVEHPVWAIETKGRPAYLTGASSSLEPDGGSHARR